MTSTSQVLRKKTPYSNVETGSSEKQAVWRVTQKTVSWIRDLAGSLRSEGGLMISFCAGMCSMKSTCMLVGRHRTSDFRSVN